MFKETNWKFSIMEKIKIGGKMKEFKQNKKVE
jgi:hypothetical protein